MPRFKILLAICVAIGLTHGSASRALVATNDNLQGTITVSAASSLSESFVEIAKEFQKENPKVKI
ncbi:MAG: hypothetical protein WCH63_10805, partial [Actinomycetota bacterium]